VSSGRRDDASLWLYNAAAQLRAVNLKARESAPSLLHFKEP